MAQTREILTLQFGNYANYIGTHWWNIQESSFNYDSSVQTKSEINHDVLFREGRNYKGDVTYTPRLLLVDLKGVLKHYPEQGELYEPPLLPSHQESIEKARNAAIWDPGSIELVQDPVVEPHSYQQDLVQTSAAPQVPKEYDFGATVESWPDYMYSRFHPRTVSLLRDLHHSSENNPFDTFTFGKSKWKENNFDDEFADKIRNYVEECDYMQGFQVLFDCVDGFSGLATECIEHLNDEYSYSILAYPVIPPSMTPFKNCDGAMSDSIRLVNIAVAYSQLNELSSLFVPLSTMSKGWRQIDNPRSLPLVTYKPDSYYQTSSILASYLDTVSLGFRLNEFSSACFLPGLCSDLSNYGRKMAGAGFTFPFRMSPTEDFIDCLDRAASSQLLTDLSPGTQIGTDRVIQHACIRGIPNVRLKRPLQEAQKQMQMAAYRCNSTSEMMQLYFQCSYYSSMSHCTAVETAMTVKTPFPREMFHKNLNFAGFYSEFEVAEKQNVSSCPALASIQNTAKLADTLESLHREAKRIRLPRIHRFKETGLEADDYTEVLEQILELKYNYEENFEL